MKRKPLFFILPAVFVLMVLFAASGCKKAGAVLSPEQVVEQFIAAYKNRDLEKMKALYSSRYLASFSSDFDEIGLSFNPGTGVAEDVRVDFFVAMLDNTEFKITGHSIDGKSAKVNMENKIPNLEMLFAQFFEIYAEEVDFEKMSTDEITLIFFRHMVGRVNEADKVEQVIWVPLVLEGGAWKIDGNLIGFWDGDFNR